MPKRQVSISDEDAFEALSKWCGQLYGKIEGAGYASLTREEKMVHLVLGYEGGARNGTIAGHLGNLDGEHIEDLIQFLWDLNAGAIAKDLESVLKEIRKISPDFPKSGHWGKDSKELARVNAETSAWLFEYEPTLPQLLYSYLLEREKR